MEKIRYLLVNSSLSDVFKHKLHILVHRIDPNCRYCWPSKVYVSFYGQGSSRSVNHFDVRGGSIFDVYFLLLIGVDVFDDTSNMSPCPVSHSVRRNSAV